MGNFTRGKKGRILPGVRLPWGLPAPDPGVRPGGSESTVLGCPECTPVWAGTSQWTVQAASSATPCRTPLTVAQGRPLTLTSGKDWATRTAAKRRGVLVLEIKQPRPGSSSGGKVETPPCTRFPVTSTIKSKRQSRGRPLCSLPGTTLLFLWL